MSDALLFAWGNFVKLFFLFCPFFVLNMFLSLTEGASSVRKRSVAVRVTFVAVTVGSRDKASSNSSAWTWMASVSARASS